MSNVPELMKIKSQDPKSQGPFVMIEKDDFDKNKHTEYKGKATIPAAPPTTPAPEPNKTEIEDEEAFASVEAIKAAEEAGLVSKDIKGTGKEGKITMGDVKAAVKTILEDDDEFEN